MQPNRIATVGQLRAALEGIPDDTPLLVNAAAYPGKPEFVDEQVITSTGFGVIDWGDGYGPEPDTVFALNCHVELPSEHIRRKPIRPAPQPAAEPTPAADPEAEGVSAPQCRTCGATGELEPVTSIALADGARRTEWSCADTAACSHRRFPELAELPGTEEATETKTSPPEAEAEL